MDDNAKREFIKALVEHLESQKAHGLLFISFCIGLIAITLHRTLSTTDPLILTGAQKLLLGIGLSFISLSTVFYMIWNVLLHQLRIIAIDYYATLNVDEARRLHYPGNAFYKRWGWIHILATSTLTIGLAGYIALIFVKVFGLNITFGLVGSNTFVNVDLSLLASASALAIAILSFYFSRSAGRVFNRPPIIVRIFLSDYAGDSDKALWILVENLGNRHAKNLKLSVNPTELKTALVNELDESLRIQVEQYFSESIMIPILVNGNTVAKCFGRLSKDTMGIWSPSAKINAEVSYEDFDGTKFTHSVPLLLINN